MVRVCGTVSDRERVSVRVIITRDASAEGEFLRVLLTLRLRRMAGDEIAVESVFNELISEC